MRRSQAELAREESIAFFDGTSRKALTLTNLVGILDDHGDEWRLARTMTLNKFIHFLLDRTQLTMHKFPFPSQSTTLYYWGSPMVYEIAMQLRPTVYLSHLTAMQYHNLLEANTQRTIYINVEQSPKPMHPGELDQSRIDAAFRRPPRLTRNRAQVEDYTYCLLSGKNTSMLEVRNEKAPGIADPIKVTSLERTLVDIVVRPAYSGGARYILEAYRRAADKVDI